MKKKIHKLRIVRSCDKKKKAQPHKRNIKVESNTNKGLPGMQLKVVEKSYKVNMADICLVRYRYEF